MPSPNSAVHESTASCGEVLILQHLASEWVLAVVPGWWSFQRRRTEPDPELGGACSCCRFASASPETPHGRRLCFRRLVPVWRSSFDGAPGI